MPMVWVETVKLFVYMLRKSLQEHDEAIFNRQFPIFSFYHIASLCSVILQEPIPDHRYVMELYAIYNKARRDGDSRKIIQTITLLKKERLKAEPLIKRTLDKFKTVNTEETNRPEVWTKASVGVLAHEESSDE